MIDQISDLEKDSRRSNSTCPLILGFVSMIDIEIEMTKINYLSRKDDT